MDINEFAKIAVKHSMAKSEHNLLQYLDVLFNRYDFNGKSFLDIGGGTGVFTHYAAICGAARAICMEPESDGSTSGVTETFNSAKSALGLGDSVTLDKRLFQDCSGDPFDMVLLHNSINHLDEEACEKLMGSNDAKDTYIELFKRLNLLVAPGGTLIVCDCGKRNFFNDFGMVNPFMKTIEWHKHQQPRVWGGLMEEAGFNVNCIKWNTFNSLGKAGPLLLGYLIPSYFTLSHFRLYATKATV